MRIMKNAFFTVGILLQQNSLALEKVPDSLLSFQKKDERRLPNRNFIAKKMFDLFFTLNTNTASEELRNGYKLVYSESILLILNSPMFLKGPCLHQSPSNLATFDSLRFVVGTCPETSQENDIFSLFSKSSPQRDAIIVQACERIIFPNEKSAAIFPFHDNQFVINALEQANLTITTPVSMESAQKLFDLFSPGDKITDERFQKMEKTLNTSSNLVEKWKILLSMFCIELKNETL